MSDFFQELKSSLDTYTAKAIEGLLSHDPKPSYQHDGRIYGMKYDGYEVKFTYVENVIVVVEVTKE